MESRIMYIENKGDEEIIGFGRIGLVDFSKSGRTVYYKGHKLEKYKSITDTNQTLLIMIQEIPIGFLDARRMVMIRYIRAQQK